MLRLTKRSPTSCACEGVRCCGILFQVLLYKAHNVETHLQARHLPQLLALQRMKHHTVVQPVEKLWPEMTMHHGHDRLPGRSQLLGRGPLRGPLRGSEQQVGAKVRREDDDGVGKIDGAACAVGEAPVVQHTQQDVENLFMCFFNFVKEHHAVGLATHCLCQLAAYDQTHVLTYRGIWKVYRRYV